MIKFHEEVVQGSDEWMACRCGRLTASQMKLVITPTLKVAVNKDERAHLYELLAQRISGHVEPQYISDSMIRGQDDEIEARAVYAQHYAPVQEVGFITNDEWGFTIGYSPDGLVGDDGLIEIKSRAQRFQVQTIVDGSMPDDFLIQVQTGLLVTKRKWLDFISYSGGLPMATIRVLPNLEVQDAIVSAASAFEQRLSTRLAEYRANMDRPGWLIPTERRVEQEMFV